METPGNTPRSTPAMPANPIRIAGHAPAGSYANVLASATRLTET